MDDLTARVVSNARRITSEELVEGSFIYDLEAATVAWFEYADKAFGLPERVLGEDGYYRNVRPRAPLYSSDGYDVWGGFVDGFLYSRGWRQKPGNREWLPEKVAT